LTENGALYIMKKISGEDMDALMAAQEKRRGK
jgi:hypothetical protein